MNAEVKQGLSKVPEVTFLFWVIKILATTLGETGGDAVSMSMDLGYLVATGIFAVVFVAAVAAQIAAAKFHPSLYWTTIIASTTVGTTLADFATRSLGIGYAGGSSLLLLLLVASLAVWYRTMGTVAVDSVSSPSSEMFYWVTIMFSQTLGTALGDWTADTAGFGYVGAAAVFGALLALVAAGYFWTRIPRSLLFWAAFVLTRPLGAVVGDFLDKPIESGGLALSRYTASAVLLVFIVACILLFRQQAAIRRHRPHCGQTLVPFQPAIRHDAPAGHTTIGGLTMTRRTAFLLGFTISAFGTGSLAAAADLPKAGTYSGHYGWTFNGQVQQLGPDRTVYAGIVPGVMFNDEGKGFMHKARVDCTLFNDVNHGQAKANGTCVVTDADGDKIFVVWNCTGKMPACPGTERFVGGTGKYTGISGNEVFQGNFIGDTGAGWSDWKGEYKLP